MFINFRLPALLLIIIWVLYKVIYYGLNRNRFKLHRELLSTLCFIYAVGVISVTIFPLAIGLQESFPTKNNYVPFASINELLHHFYFMVPLRNIGGNILLFVPFGILIPMKFKKVNKGFKIVLLGFLSSLTIECIQLWLTFRSFDIDDIILNSFGVYIGFLIYKWITLIFMSRQSDEKIHQGL
ncbi:vanZ like family protein (plasmid) [Bacillus pseudomycoides]|uniref:VanZ family protein n=1 Tax=Bacillus TaxID=1386 RepID=UPI000368B4B2|nr:MULTISPECIES: VanZ family protein [Bacillus]AIK35421.1 vanZ like family protein [Bacillus pseudomycoides]AJI14691.1 vanZ like family protein [Bacillus pseudomycoides]MEB3056754.1 VanZ family protein [Bacillus pseudomycoides]